MQFTVREIPVNQIRAAAPHREPPAWLVESMAEIGLCGPVHVCARSESRYDLLAGARRLEAARQLGWPHIPAFVEPSDAAGPPAELKAILLHIQRRNLEYLYIAQQAEKLLQERGGTQAKLARKLGLTKTILTAMLQVNRCPELVAAISEQGLEFGAAKALLPLSPPDQRALLAELREEKRRSGRFPPVRHVEERVRQRQGKEPLLAVGPERVADVLEELRAQDVPLEIKLGAGKQSHLQVTLVLTETDRLRLQRFLAAEEEESPHVGTAATARSPSPHVGRVAASSPPW